jgi:hypothetical protein
MAFTAHGLIHQIEYTITVHDDGRLDADEATLHVLTELAALYDGEPVGPYNGPHTFETYLSNTLSAYHLLPSLFDALIGFSGNPPPVPAGCGDEPLGEYQGEPEEGDT